MISNYMCLLKKGEIHEGFAEEVTKRRILVGGVWQNGRNGEGGSERVTYQHRGAGRASLGCSGLCEGNFLRLSARQEQMDDVGRGYAVIVECSRKDLQCSVVGHWVSWKELGRDWREAVLG